MNEMFVVGFDARLLAPMGRARAIIYNTSDKRFFVSAENSNESKPIATTDTAELATWEAEGRFTRLPKPVPAIPNGIVVYVRHNALNEIGQLPEATSGEKLSWQRLDTESEAWATLSNRRTAVTMLNTWGLLLLAKINHVLSGYLQNGDATQGDALALTKMALSAARSQSLRESIYLRYGLALRYTKEPESLSNVHRMIAREIPRWTWSIFREEMQRVEDELAIRRLKPDVPVPASKAAVNSFFAQVEKIKRLDGKDRQMEAARECASMVTLEPFSREESMVVLQEQLAGRDHSRVVLSAETFSLLRTEPLCYLPDVIMPLTNRVALDLREFGDLIEEYVESGVKGDPLTAIERVLVEA